MSPKMIFYVIFIRGKKTGWLGGEECMLSSPQLMHKSFDSWQKLFWVIRRVWEKTQRDTVFLG